LDIQRAKMRGIRVADGKIQQLQMKNNKRKMTPAKICSNAPKVN